MIYKVYIVRYLNKDTKVGLRQQLHQSFIGSNPEKKKYIYIHILISVFIFSFLSFILEHVYLKIALN